MDSRTLIRRSLRFYARAHLGVVLGAAIGSAALIGALLVGDSVRETLRQRAVARLGPFHFALYAPDRLLWSDWPIMGGPPFQPGGRVWVPDGAQTSALLLPGLAARPDGSARANRVNVIGVDDLWPFGTDPAHPGGKPAHGPGFPPWMAAPAPEALLKLQSALEDGTALINQALARQLGLKPGDEIIARVRRPSGLALDAALSPREENLVALRLKVGAILRPDQLGDFSLAAQPAPALNLFLSRYLLAVQLGVPWRANLVACGAVVELGDTGWFTEQRYALSQWLLRRAPRVRAGTGAQAGPMPNPASLAMRAAVWVRPGGQRPIPDERALPAVVDGLRRTWLPENAGLSIHALRPTRGPRGERPGPAWVELADSRIFLEPPVVAAALKPRTTLLTNHFIVATRGEPGFMQDSPSELAAAQFVTNGVPILTYLANAIRAGERLTPYSMVTAAGPPFTPAGMRDDEILVNQWLADDLQIKPGDSVALSYYVADSGSRLSERTNSFRVRAVVPLEGLYADRTLMPDFPGVAKAESTHDWNTGFPLVHKIRDKDEAYWKDYRGTPKAFVTLAAGQAMWANRFGSLTAIRYPVRTNSMAADIQGIVVRDIVSLNLLANLDPADLGLRVEPVRAQALRAADQGQDFGQLFLGFSFFLVVAALLLMALLFQFGLEERAAEVGTLLALGFTVKRTRRLLLAEGAALALAGGVLGALGGLAYARAMLWGLATMWRDAVGSTALEFHATRTSLAIGFCASTAIAVLTISLTLRKLARQPIPALLGGEAAGREFEVEGPKLKARGWSGWMGMAAALAAAAIVCWALLAGQRANAGAFFGAGALLLLAGLGGMSAWLRHLGQGSPLGVPPSGGSPSLEHPAQDSRAGGPRHPLTPGGLSLRNCARRRRRSLATAALLACGCFVIVAIGVFRLEAGRDAHARSSGTGGFALLGESTLPVVQDLNTKAGLNAFGLSARALPGVNIVQCRVHNGDEASCLNLNRAQQPRLLGVKPELLAGRFTFTAAASGYDRNAGWALLKSEIPNPESQISNLKSEIPNQKSKIKNQESEIPAIGDANAIEWALGKQLGDTIDYTDERGRAFKVRLVGAVANSILQGSLLIDEAQFVKRFPNESGYRFFLLDAPEPATAQVSATLSRALQDTGLELTPTLDRLNALNAVQNTYLGTFQVLGGLGLLLGSAGLGVVVLRNVLERRGELGLFLAVGFRRRTLQGLVLGEHGALLGLGLSLGIASALVAVLPSVLTPGQHLPWASLALTLAAVLLNGALWTWLATRFALRGDLLAALRNE